MNTNCDVQINNWVIPTAVGSISGFVAGMLARTLAKGDSDATRHTVGYIVETGTFMLVGGIAFFMMARRPKSSAGWLNY